MKTALYLSLIATIVGVCIAWPVVRPMILGTAALVLGIVVLPITLIARFFRIPFIEDWFERMLSG
jgi:hypothetical protein